jgi:hypothetical protein
MEGIMKKFIGFISLLMILVLASSAFPAGTVTQTAPVALFDSKQPFGIMGTDPKYMVTATMTADVSTAYTFPSFQINGTCSSAAPTASPSCTVANTLLGWYLFKVELWAGSPPPSGAMTVTVKDSNGVGYDYCAGKISGGNSTTPTVVDCYSIGQSYMPVNGPLTVAITGTNSTSVAVFYLIFYFLPR